MLDNALDLYKLMPVALAWEIPIRIHCKTCHPLSNTTISLPHILIRTKICSRSMHLSFKMFLKTLLNIFLVFRFELAKTPRKSVLCVLSFQYMWCRQSIFIWSSNNNNNVPYAFLHINSFQVRPQRRPLPALLYLSYFYTVCSH